MEPVVEKIAEQYKAVHAQLRDEVRDCSVAELNWKPAPETNSIAVLVVHTLGSEAEVLRVTAKAAGERDRDAEFRATAENAEDLLRELDQADSYLEALAPRITAENLAAELARGEREPQTGLHWLVNNYGHAREHLGHIQLTRQLYSQARSA
ncbi:MAG: DinB family protein [Thermomicrobiales bacterium]